MRRYGGELIYQTRDDFGVLEVVDAHGVRSLHFGTSPRQSALSLKEPHRLELGYVRALLSPLLFTGDPRKVLLVGLGGGSLARFLLEQFPGCRLEAVERRAKVVEIAHVYFGLPRDDRLVIHIAEAFELVETLARQSAEAYDLILVDAYDHLGMDSSIVEPDFLDACARMVMPHGALAMNLWGTHPVSFKKSIALLKARFADKAMRLAVPNRGNVIGLGLGEAVAPFKQKTLECRARELQFQTGLEMPYFLRNLRVIA